jgi:hypothetical protein
MRRIALLTVLAALVPAGTAGASFTQDTASPLASGAAPYSVAAADFDGNGRPDLVTANGTAGSASVFLRGLSSGFTEEPGSPYSGGIGGASDVVAAKLDGDGAPDFAVASYAETDGGRVYLRDTSDNVGFTTGPTLAIPNTNSVAAGRLNDDQNPDLVFGGGTDAFVYYVLRNSSNTGYDPPVSLVASGVTHDVAVGDFTGDGRADIVASTETGATSGNVDLWTRDAGSTVHFTARTPVVMEGSPYGLAVADFNGDGKPDVGVSVYSANKLVVLLGHGNGTLTKEASYPGGVGPVGLATGDFDGNGRPDLAAGNQAGKSVTVLLRGNTGFAPDPSSPILTNLAATGIAIADINADGRADIAASNIDKSFISVLLNSTPPPPPPPPPDLDKDDDGVQTPLDCDDGNPLIKPGAFDVPGDGINQDCSADGDADYPLPGMKIKYSVLTYPAGYSQFAKLTLAPVKAGDKVVLKCKGRGCTFKRKTFNVKQNKPRLSLLKPLKKAKLRKGAAVTMRMTRAGTYGSYARWKIRATGSKFKSLCLRPGNTKPVKCPST